MAAAARAGWANRDGRISPAGEARVSPLDRGFLFGEAVYENLRTYGGVPLLFGEHLTRLRRSAAFLGIPLRLSDEEITARLEATRRAAGTGSEHSLRIILTAGPEDGDPSLLVLVRPLPPLPVDPEQEGVGVRFTRWQRAGAGGLPPAVKTNNLLVARLAVREAQAVGAHEALLANAAGELTEGATSNVFLVKQGEVLTPPLESGLLPGITRRLAFRVFGELGVACRETRLRDSAFAEADEAFITSSSREILPVTWTVAARETSVGKSSVASVEADESPAPRRPVGNGRPGLLTLRGLRHYRRAVARLVKSETGAA